MRSHKKGPRGRDDYAGPFCDVAKRLQRAWKEDIAPAAKHGEIGRGRGRDALRNSIDANPTSADGILRRLKRDHPAQAVKGKPHAGRGVKGSRLN